MMPRLRETVRMVDEKNETPALLKDNDFQWSCSGCDIWKYRKQKAKTRTPARWQEEAESHFADHLRQDHSPKSRPSGRDRRILSSPIR
jgi:hypothetical protein